MDSQTQLVLIKLNLLDDGGMDIFVGTKFGASYYIAMTYIITFWFPEIFFFITAIIYPSFMQSLFLLFFRPEHRVKRTEERPGILPVGEP